MANGTGKSIRTIDDPGADHHAIKVITFNAAAGSTKVSEVGRHLLPIPTSTGFTTNATSALMIPPGKCLAVYNNAGAVGSITLGEDATITSLASGVTDASGHVGIPCAPNAWTYIACAAQVSVIASAATLLVFLVDDLSSLKVEALR